MPELLDYQSRVHRARGFIAANLHRKITLAEVAADCGLSAFHFHRIFDAVTGEPLAQHVQRLRMELAALRLAYHRDLSITDIALRSSYSSSANFAKAVSEYFGYSPSKIRRAPEHLSSRLSKIKSRYGKDFHPLDLYAHGHRDEINKTRLNSLSSRIRLETRPGFTAASLTNSGGYDLASGQRCWVELLTRCQGLGLIGEDADAYGLCHSSPALTAPERRHYDACVRIPRAQPLPVPLFTSEIPAGRYAVLSYTGHFSGLEAEFRDVYGLWFAESGMLPDDFPPMNHYITGPPDADGMLELELMFKLR